MTNFGREFVLIGMDNESLRQICQGKPLVVGPVPGDPALANIQIIIAHGESLEDITKTLDMSPMTEKRRDEPEGGRV